MGWRNANTMYANVAVDVPRTRAGRNVNCRAASRAGSSNGGAERITLASAPPPRASTCTSTSTIPFSRASGGHDGIALTWGPGETASHPTVMLHLWVPGGTSGVLACVASTFRAREGYNVDRRDRGARRENPQGILGDLCVLCVLCG